MLSRLMTVATVVAKVAHGASVTIDGTVVDVQYPPDELTLSHLALMADDECDVQDETCALNAAQLRAYKSAAARAQGQLEADPDDDASALAKKYGQCGGAKWTGPTACPKHFKCVEDNEYYSQCQPEDAPAPSHSSGGGGGGASAAPPKAMPRLKANPPLPPAPKMSEPLPPIVIKGNFMYNSKTGERFFSKGIAYNPRNIKFNARQMHDEGNCTPGTPELGQLQYAEDPTQDKYESMWKPALNAMAEAGMNTVRLYNIDPEVSHEKFMAAASALGMYVIVPLTRHDWGFMPTFTAPECYTQEIDGYGNVGTNLLVSAKLIVRQFSKYDNVLLFTVANELTVLDSNGFAAYPCVKALTRDIHQYQQTCAAGMRRVPLIYADMDMGPPDRKIVAQYLSCKLESDDDVVDAHGLNVYSWCDNEYPDDHGKDNFQWSPYYPIMTDFEHFDKPVLMTEFGCNTGEFKTECPYKGGRSWSDIPTFFSQFKEILSGALAFEFSMEDNEYGVALTPGFTSDPENDKKIYLLDNYYSLKKQFESHNVAADWDGAKITDCNWKPSDAHPLSKTHTASVCPSDEVVQQVFKRHHIKDAPNWNSPLPPTPENVNDGDLATCPDYKVSKTVHDEGCCHMKC